VKNWLLGLVANFDVWPITWTISETWSIWLVNIVGGLLVVVVMELIESVVSVPNYFYSDLSEFGTSSLSEWGIGGELLVIASWLSLRLFALLLGECGILN
jgi:hypothetical protein